MVKKGGEKKCTYQDPADFAGNQNSFLAVRGVNFSEVRVVRHQMVLSGINDDMTLPDGEKKRVSIHKFDIL